MSYLTDAYYEQMDICFRNAGQPPITEDEKELVNLFLPIQFNVDFLIQERGRVAK